jgi:hypothetical protein
MFGINRTIDISQPLWACTMYYRDSFTFFPKELKEPISISVKRNCNHMLIIFIEKLVNVFNYNAISFNVSSVQCLNS